MYARALVFVILATCAMTNSAHAQTHLTGGFGETTPYVGASVGLLRYDESGLATISPSVIFARVGLPLSSFFAIEGRLGTGLSSDETNGDSVSVGTFGGAYAKGSVAVAPIFSLYAVAGVATVNLHRNYGDGDSTNTGFSAGAGGDVRLMRALYLNFEWTYLPNGSQAGHSYSSNLISAGVNYHF
jgi:opacity protein-like surface antigen